MPLPEKSSNFSQRHLLFRSGKSDDLYPHEHRRSVVEHAAEGVHSVTLTDNLLRSLPDEFKAATEAPFLQAAGKGTLSKKILSQWLSQDRLYAETYICFVSSLISRVAFPYGFVPDKSRSLRWRLLRLLTGALENIQRELDFFTSTAEEYDLDLEQPMSDDDDDDALFVPVQATQQYIDLFRSFFTDPSLPLIEGLVVLWATEQCYLSAWKHASTFLNHDSDRTDADGGALRNRFIPNWTSDEFQEFVDEIAEVTNLVAARENAGKKLAVYTAVWSHVLDIEKRFWPQIDTED